MAGPALAEGVRNEGTRDIAALAERVREGNDPLAAIDALAALPARTATTTLGALLLDGLPDASTDRILESFGERPRPGALQALERMAGHRRPGARVRALRAIAALGAAEAKHDARATEQLAAALGDSDAQVRGAAALALGRRFERLESRATASAAVDEAALDALLRALARGVPEAARAAGLATPETALPRLHAALAGLPLTATLEAYDAALGRTRLSEAAKLELVARLGEIATPATKAFLAGLIGSGRFARSGALQRALIATEKRIDPRATTAGAAP